MRGSLIGFLLILCSAGGGVAQAANPEWSLIMYAATDEQELATYVDPAIERLLKLALPDSVEILIEQDTFLTPGVRRIVRNNGMPNQVSLLPEHDSASPNHFGDFLAWAKATARGQHQLLVVLSHSWGWKGIIQDFQVPGPDGGIIPDKDTMMPLRHFAREFALQRFSPDILFLDSCILGNVEAIEELKNVSRYLVVSERETPYSGIPYKSLIRLLGQPGFSVRDVAARLPEKYVRAYAHGGALARAEGEYDEVTLATIDTSKWQNFVDGFRALVNELRLGGFREMIASNPNWPEKWWDIDSNVDIVELLSAVTTRNYSAGVRKHATRLLDQIGYPGDVAARSSEVISISGGGGVRSFLVETEADPFLVPDKALKALTTRWLSNNQDLGFEESQLKFEIKEKRTGKYFIVRGSDVDSGSGGGVEATARNKLLFRPWLPGVRQVKVKWVDAAWNVNVNNYSRESDYFVARDFPASSFLVAEAHTQGTPFIHGLGISFEPLMTNDEERSADFETGLSGPSFYKTIGWNRNTGWGDLIFLNRE